MKRLPAGTALLGLLATAACYSYRSIPVDELRPDLAVHLRVKPEAAEHLVPVVGYLTQDVDGRVISLQHDTVLLAVRSPLTAQTSPEQQLYQRLDVPVAQLIEVQQRHLNRTKTYMGIAVAAVGAGALAVWAFTSPSLFGSQSTPPVINNAVAPAPLLPRHGVGLPLGQLHLRP